MTLRRVVQTVCLVLFALLALGTAEALVGGSAVPFAPGRDLLVRLDPAAALLAAVADRSVSLAILPGLAVLASGLVLGRAFCGWVCPFGAMLDITDPLLRRLAGKRRNVPRAGGRTLPRRLKFGVLAGLLSAAACGVSLAFWAAPLPLAARLWGLAGREGLSRLADAGLRVIDPLARGLGATGLAFAEVKLPSYATLSFTLLFFALAFGLGLLGSRVWCRCLCPAGAALGLLSRLAPWCRTVGEGCTSCGACARACPAGAIGSDFTATDHAECLKCLRCRDTCPQDVVRFGFTRTEQAAFSPLRRTLVGGAALGAGAAALGLYGPALGAALAKGNGPGVLRPPGALPEQDFLARCVRCGLCATACPTNTLQPAWLAAGGLGMFSPVVTPVKGFCNPLCHACAPACPTAAIRVVAPGDRLFAKLGTAYIERKDCLAWEKKKKCLVCDEVCPYDAISFKPEPDNPVRVPHVDAKRCAGCGFCEHHCPAVNPVRGSKAIVVRAKDALRPRTGSLRAAAEGAGLRLIYTPKKKGTDGAQGAEPPAPEPSPNGLPPGFSE
ncbi:4Fe-4S ferredoxin, iron-sulpur binding domain-containing protein [Desulfovibrio sp. X2]|uniref:4Fe-4S binding protein n=1 Tax=Desulfovibrio sp. X2 TaxID=941449 RepID=UPI0003589392|nr:4Fe-4S binding protein [Desulfovibrio sp. X2]EPR42658.1 4Fe-4S ferredoxin, iron-sulpur binding domain-containing protein [Desulfovibrio sp. X2]